MAVESIHRMVHRDKNFPPMDVNYDDDVQHHHYNGLVHENYVS